MRYDVRDQITNIHKKTYILRDWSEARQYAVAPRGGSAIRPPAPEICNTYLTKFHFKLYKTTVHPSAINYYNVLHKCEN